MPINSFTPNTKIESAKVNSNFLNFSDHALNFAIKFSFPSGLTTQTKKDAVTLGDDATITRVDLICDTAPTGANIIVDLERSLDSGGTWTTIFTGGTNRPQVAAGSRVGNTTTIDLPSIVGNSTLLRAVISQVGSTIPGSDLSVVVKGTYNLD